MNSQQYAPRKMTKADYRAQWMKAQEEIHMLRHGLGVVEDLMRESYEGVVGEEPPAYEVRVQWDVEQAS